MDKDRNRRLKATGKWFKKTKKVKTWTNHIFPVKDYKKLFSRYWGISADDVPLCWGCNQAVGVDIHHLISKGMGGVKRNRLNRIDNLFLLCRKCHTMAHKNKAINEEYKKILQERIKIKEQL